MENQNNQPDYNFILNQPGDSPPPKIGKSHKKLLRIGIGLLIFIVLMLALTAWASRQATSNQAASTAPPSVNPVNQLLIALKAKDYTKAAGYLPQTQNDLTTAAQNLKTSFADYNIESCTVSTLQGNNVTSYSDLSCRRTDNKSGMVVHFQIAQANGKPIILNYSVVAS